jgi:hypothetical protein
MAPAITKSKQETSFVEKVQTVMMSVCTVGVLGCFKFLWTINATMSAQAVTINNNIENITRIDNRVDNLEKMSADHADRITKLELKKN